MSWSVQTPSWGLVSGRPARCGRTFSPSVEERAGREDDPLGAVQALDDDHAASVTVPTFTGAGDLIVP
jgi:hypothetical protein